MKQSTIVAVLIFVALGAAAYYSMTRKPERGITRVDFAQVDPAVISAVAISGKNPIQIKKDGELWKLGNGKEADAASVKRLVDKIPEIVSSHVVTKDPARFAELEVDEEKGSRVQASVGSAVVADFIVGKAGAGGGHVRVDDAVYLVKGVYPGVFSKEASAWHQLKLFDEKLEDVTWAGVGLADKGSYTLVKQEDAWSLTDAGELPDGFRFDANAARSLVSTLVNARAREVLDADPGVETTGLDEAADALVFVGKDDARHELHLGKAAEEKKVYARVGGKPDVFTLPEHTVKNLRKAATDLRDLGLVTLEKEKVRFISFKSDAVKLSFKKQDTQWWIDKTSGKVPDGFELDSMAVHRKIQAMDSARGTKLAPAEVTPAKAGLARPSATVTAKYEDGTAFTLVFGAEFKDDERDVVYARGTVDDSIYVVSKWIRDNFTSTLDKYQKRDAPSGGGMPNIDPAALSNLPPDVRAQLMKQMQQKQREQAMMQQIQAQMEAKKAAGETKPAPEETKPAAE